MEPEREYDRLQTLELLVREAYDVVNNPASVVDLRDWSRSVRAVLDPPPPEWGA
jgi:hypothetical protein